jgi:hypothetical protein
MGEAQAAVCDTNDEGLGTQQSVAVVLSDGCRLLRRQLSALAWVILEQVALDAVLDEGRLLARTSAGQIAEELAVNQGTAARALRMLRQKGLLVLHRDARQAGRFGKSVYELNPVAGLKIKAPDLNASGMVHTSDDESLMAEPRTVRASVVTPLMENPHVVKPLSARRGSRAVSESLSSPALHGDAQVALDLELES